TSPNLQGNPPGPLYGASNYATNNLLFNKRVRLTDSGPKLPGSIPDGSSNTIMFAEEYAACSAWAYDDAAANDKSNKARPAYGKPVVPAAYYVATTESWQLLPKLCDTHVPQTAHPGGIQVGMCDGSVRTVSTSLTGNTWYAANTPDGQEPLGGGD